MHRISLSCVDFAPLASLSQQITCAKLRIAIFAPNGSGKTFLSRAFRLTEKDADSIDSSAVPRVGDQFISFGKEHASFSFKLSNSHNDTLEEFAITFTRGAEPQIPATQHIFHTFNEDYVEENIKALSYQKDGNIEGFILGKLNIDVSEEQEKLEAERSSLGATVKRLQSEIDRHVLEKLDGVRDIKRLGEYKLLNYSEIVQTLGSSSPDVAKTYEALLSDYDSIKSAPEHLADIQELSRVSIDDDWLKPIIEDLRTEFRLSALGEPFKEVIRGKQPFVEEGIRLLGNKDRCPFCDQILNSYATELIAKYTEFLEDEEAKTRQRLQGHIMNLKKFQAQLDMKDNEATKRSREFDNYAAKYVPSLRERKIRQIEISALLIELDALISLLTEKIDSIAMPLPVTDEVLEKCHSAVNSLNSSIESNNLLIKSMNKKKDSLGAENRETRRALCKAVHKQLLERYGQSIRDVKDREMQVVKMKRDIHAKQEKQKVLKRSRVCATIRSVLNRFFSSKYTLDEDTFRLIFKETVLDEGQARRVLSEGERNAIAFAYYLGDVHLKIASDDDYRKLFFVIDDPISSMDYGHVYTLCQIIRELGSVFEQLEQKRFLVFTHNNEFMRVLASNRIIDTTLMLKNGELKPFNRNLTVPYVDHLVDVYRVARCSHPPTHTTANSIRHILETLTKFERLDISTESLACYVADHIPDGTKVYTLMHDLSHGGWRTEQGPISEDDYRDLCEALLVHLESRYRSQVEYCANLCKET